MLRYLNEEVILIGDNFQIPGIGLKGTVIRVRDNGSVWVKWETGKYSFFSKYQSEKWICRAKS